MGRAGVTGKRPPASALSTVMPGLDRGIHGGVRVVAGMDPAVEPRGDGKGENRAPPLVKGDDFPQTDIRPALTI